MAPIAMIAYSYVFDGGVVAPYHRKGKGLSSLGSSDNTTVTIGLFLEILAGLNLSLFTTV